MHILLQINTTTALHDRTRDQSVAPTFCRETKNSAGSQADRYAQNARIYSPLSIIVRSTIIPNASFSIGKAKQAQHNKFEAACTETINRRVKSTTARLCPKISSIWKCTTIVTLKLPCLSFWWSIHGDSTGCSSARECVGQGNGRFRTICWM